VKISFNTEQIKGLSGFLFDMAKGYLLGGLGLIAIVEGKIPIIILTSFIAGFCVLGALVLLERL